MFVRIGYLDVKVASEEIKELQGLINNPNSPHRILSVRKLEFLRELDRKQKSGLHTTFIEEDGRLTCTCGLTILSQKFKFEGETDFLDRLGRDSLEKLPQIGVDEIYTIRGHQRLPRCKDRAVALIYHELWNEQLREFIYSAFCQGCMAQISDAKGKDARTFVRLHNKSCGGLKPGEGGI